jgi:hypothetical protein
MRIRAAVVALTLVGLCALTALPGANAGGTMVWEIATQADFATGELDGLSLMQSGRLVAGPSSEFTAIDGETVWASAVASDGALWLGTGNAGKLYRAKDGKVAEVYDAAEVIISALAADRSGSVYAGTLGTGQIYKAQGDKVTAFAKLPAAYIWALAIRGDGGLYAATGPEGAHYQVDATGNATLLYDSPEQNLLSLLVVPDADGNEMLIFGSSPNGIVYARDDRTRVLADLPENDVKGLAWANNALYAAANSVKNLEIDKFLQQVAGAVRSEAASAARTDNRRTVVQALKGTVYRISGDRAPQALYAIEKNYFTDIAAGRDGVYVSCGSEGLVWAVGENDARLLIDRPEDQAQTLAVVDGHLRYIGTGGAAGFVTMRPDVATAGTYTSKALDAGHTSRWGRLYWTGDGTVTAQVRTGNTTKPDDTWSPWTAAIARSGGAVDAPAGRYYQFKLVWPGGVNAARAWVGSVSIYYVRDNQRPVVSDVTVSGAALKSRAVVATKALPVREITWKAADGDGDKLMYVVQVLRRGDDANDGWQTISGDNPIADAKLAWDTTSVPDGVYVARVIATDSASNALGRELVTTSESAWFTVDNKAPTIEGLAWDARARRVSGTATDAGGTIASIEASANGSDWSAIASDDGVLDSASETFAFPVANDGTRRVLVRVTDGAGNTVVGAVNLR